MAHTEQPSFLEEIRQSVDEANEIRLTLEHHKNALIKYKQCVSCNYMLSFHDNIKIEIFRTIIQARQNDNFKYDFDYRNYGRQQEKCR